MPMHLVSACLAGCPCRYDSTSCPNAKVQQLVDSGQALPVCPEQLAGLPTPRESCEIRTDPHGRIAVIGKSGRDYTNEFLLGAERTLAICIANGITKAILKSKSPSCGSGEIYDGRFSGQLVPGDGLTAELLKKNGIDVITEREPD